MWLCDKAEGETNRQEDCFPIGSRWMRPLFQGIVCEWSRSEYQAIRFIFSNQTAPSHSLTRSSCEISAHMTRFPFFSLISSRLFLLSILSDTPEGDVSCLQFDSPGFDELAHQHLYTHFNLSRRTLFVLFIFVALGHLTFSRKHG